MNEHRRKVLTFEAFFKALKESKNYHVSLYQDQFVPRDLVYPFKLGKSERFTLHPDKFAEVSRWANEKKKETYLASHAPINGD